ncbi:MAG: bifunctional DNA primase/polymerase [Acidimicrobiales bacterium]
MENKDLAAAAIKLATSGHPVIPLHHIDQRGRCSCGRSCASPGKHPRTLNGLKDASVEPAVVAAWWRRSKLSNIGLATGFGGLWVLDVDGDAGEETLAHLEREHGPLPTTRWVRTGSGGRHAYLRLPPGVDLGNSSRKLGPGLDTRGSGGYAVAPPSGHVSGGVYSWLNQERAAEVPRWMLDLLRPPPRPPVRKLACERLPSTSRRAGYGGAALALEESSVRMAIPGSRNHRLNSASFNLGQLVGSGLLELDAVAGALLVAALASGLGETEAMRTIESGLAAGQRCPRGRTA